MKKLFLLTALLCMTIGAMATKINWNPSGWVATWNGETKTMSWNGSDGYKVMNTGLATGDLSAYTKIRATITSITGDNNYIQLKVVSTGKSDQFINLYEGINNIVFADYASDIDFTQVTEISLWGTGASDGSAVITEMYLYNPLKESRAFDSFGDEITDISYLTGGGTFVMANASSTTLTTFESGSAGATETPLANLTEDLFDYYTIEELPALDIDEDGNTDAATYYRIGIYHADGTAKPSNWWGANYVDIIGWGQLWSTNCAPNETADDHYGRDGKYRAVWTITYVEGSGFKFVNPKTNKYLSGNGSSDSETFMKLYKSIAFKTVSDLEKEENPSDDQIFALSKATGYNAETGLMNDGTWTFAVPVDLSDWDYLVIGLANTAANGSHYIKMTDNDGKTVGGNDYDGEAAHTGAGMWLDYWNSQNIIAISMDKLRISNELNIHEITSLSIAGTVSPSVVYMTDYANAKLTNRGRWTLYVEGDVARSYTTATLNKFGTICLPYVASYTGCEVYSIASAGASGVGLTKVNGLLEAGKPYFYVSTDAVGQDNGADSKDVHNVFFFRADFEKYDAATPVENNGLIGTFTTITLTPNDNFYVLSSNQLYKVDAGATGEKAVNIGANKAYVDLSKVGGSAGVKGYVELPFDGAEATGIESVTETASQSDGKIFDLSGREVNRMTRGVYIINGKKVFVK